MNGRVTLVGEILEVTATIDGQLHARSSEFSIGVTYRLTDL